ncbi:hypothetical protein QFC19_002519 [Naganishia cerealis]|uniref:Uncharacterized protein n=1 Tax=Naganishia cerealis TaxID=610337 RepID=A0ACC2WB23_9TREE|nr:hypothetical protein QFC19_002519 [Naganishia cerealis]
MANKSSKPSGQKKSSTVKRKADGSLSKRVSVYPSLRNVLVAGGVGLLLVIGYRADHPRFKKLPSTGILSGEPSKTSTKGQQSTPLDTLNRSSWPSWAKTGNVNWPHLDTTDEIHITADLSKRDAVKAAFKFHPLSKEGSNLTDAGGIGYTIIDTLDSLLLMGFDQEYERARDWIEKDLSFDADANFNSFETTIRILGGLLAAFYLTSDHPTYSADADLFLEKAVDLGDRLLPIFDSPSGIPYSLINLAARVGVPDKDNGNMASLAEAGTLQLEFKYLSHLTGDYTYWDKVERKHISWKKLDDQNTLDYIAGTGIIDSCLETYHTATLVVVPWSNPAYSGLTLVSGISGLGPEIAMFRHGQETSQGEKDWFIKSAPGSVIIDGRNILRPETVESLFLAYRATGDETYREQGWKIFQAFEEHCKVPHGGFASIENVETVPAVQVNKMETFWLVRLENLEAQRNSE